MQRTKYLEIYPSEVAARKINKHLDKMAEVKPRVYQKTLLRYKKLAYLLIECVTKIVRMLQSETLLSSGDAEFQELGSDFDIEQIDELRDSVDRLGNLVDAPSRKATQESKRISGDTLRLYKSVFKQAAALDFGYVEVNDCAKLLDYWISKRFSGFNTNFKFQIKQLPVWATFIVIAYGKYHSVGQSVKFSTDFRAWCDSLDEDNSNCWALPYNVFNMTKVVDASNFTMDALVIYDILIDKCFYQLVDCKIPVDASYVAKLLKEYHPELGRDIRTRFTRQKDLIETLNLCPTNFDAEESAI